MNIKTFSLTLLALVMLSGCYTRFGSIEQPGDHLIAEGADSLIDSTSSGARVDTIIYKEKEICIWERDFAGMPYLRCFSSYYPRDWYFYNNSPWWFRNSAYWYDYKRCPRYYNFDPDCGCCRYYQHYPYRHGIGGGKGGSGGGISSGRPDRSRSIGGSSSVPAHQGGVTLPKSSGSGNEQKSSTSPPAPDRPNRSRGFGASDINPVTPSNQSGNGNVEKKRAEAVPESMTSPDKPVQTENSDVPRTRPKRNSRW